MIGPIDDDVLPVTDEQVDAYLAAVDDAPAGAQDAAPAVVGSPVHDFELDPAAATRQAEAAMRRYRAAERDADAVRAQADEWRAEIDEWERRKLRSAQGRMEWWQAKLIRLGSVVNRTLDLPSGKVQRTEPKSGTVVVADAEAALAWLEGAGHHEAIKRAEPEILISKVRQRVKAKRDSDGNWLPIDTETGEVAPGFTAQPPAAPRYDVRG